MALSERAVAVKKQLSAAIELRRALAAAQQEWEELLAGDEPCFADEQWAAQLHRERKALQRELAQAQLKSWTRIRRVTLPEPEWRVLRWRYVQGLTWGEIIARAGKSRQYLLRLHNRALEKIAK